MVNIPLFWPFRVLSSFHSAKKKIRLFKIGQFIWPLALLLPLLYIQIFGVFRFCCCCSVSTTTINYWAHFKRQYDQNNLNHQKGNKKLRMEAPHSIFDCIIHIFVGNQFRQLIKLSMIGELVWNSVTFCVCVSFFVCFNIPVLFLTAGMWLP